MSKILVISGSNRPNRKTTGLAQWVHDYAKNYSDMDFEFVDLAELNLPFLDEPMPPLYGNYQNEHTKKWAQIVGSADGFIFVTPEYNHGYPAVLKNAIDFLGAEWFRKPVAFVAHGSNGGVRSVEQLKNVINQLQMVPVPTGLNVAFSDWDEQNNFAAGAKYEKHLGTLLDDLKWWTDALKTAREK
ncbi:MAG TPA: NADPH-dependent FMN reductase [Candidatus Saccharimonas sp.]|nr:NADPH-dependent FMN reductase [Candidatus Saccharimonas sp.]